MCIKETTDDFIRNLLKKTRLEVFIQTDDDIENLNQFHKLNPWFTDMISFGYLKVFNSDVRQIT